MLLHHLKRLLARVVGPLGKGRCIDCNSRLTTDELRYYHSQCEKCIAHDAAWLEAVERDLERRKS